MPVTVEGLTSEINLDLPTEGRVASGKSITWRLI